MTDKKKEKDTKSTLRTLTGKPADKIDNPKIDSALVQEVLSLAARRKRAIVFKRFANKIKRKRELLRGRLASPEKLEKRSRRAALNLLRKKIAGKKGANFSSLSPSEKIAISKRLESKKALITKLAKKLLPKVRKAEQVRLKAFRSNKSEEVIQDVFNAVDISFDLLESAQQKALHKKAEKSGTDVDILFEVYTRGLEDYPENSELEPDQYAFNRVNAFMVGQETDIDLIEQKKYKVGDELKLTLTRKAIAGDSYSNSRTTKKTIIIKSLKNASGPGILTAKEKGKSLRFYDFNPMKMSLNGDNAHYEIDKIQENENMLTFKQVSDKR